jgi:hypothetical protein
MEEQYIEPAVYDGETPMASPRATCTRIRPGPFGLSDPTALYQTSI